MSKHRKGIISIALFAFIFTFIACGSPKTVPEQTITWVVEDYLSQWGDYGGTYTGYQTDVKHSPDKDTKTDTVTIDIIVNYPHVVGTSSYEARYQYDKSKELWEVIRGGSWTPLHIKSCDITTHAELWSDVLNKAGYSCSTYNQDEFQDVVDSLEYWYELDPALIDLIKGGWHVNGYNWDKCCGIGALYLEMATNIDAESVFRGLHEGLLLEGYEKGLSYDGDNFSFSWYKYSGDMLDFYHLIQQDEKVFLVSSGEYYKDMKVILKEVGFIPGLDS